MNHLHLLVIVINIYFITGEICFRENKTARVASGEEAEPNDSGSQIRRNSRPGNGSVGRLRRGRARLDVRRRPRDRQRHVQGCRQALRLSAEAHVEERESVRGRMDGQEL